jgi:Protein of unknown function (DUF2793)/Chaperone of endosialidase
MSDFTNALRLPYLFSSQADKHVTINQSLEMLDNILMANVSESDQNAPPTAPSEHFKVLIGGQPTGLFVGHINELAVFLDGDWHFALPRSGWIVFLSSAQKYLVFDGTSWVDFGTKLGTVHDLQMLGIGTVADAANPFSAKLNAALWTARSPQEGGNGDLRVVINKTSTAQVGSLLFQSNYSGRGEFGLVGTDNFTLRVSSDGASWTTAFNVSANGRMELGQGIQGSLNLPVAVQAGQAHLSRGGTRLLTLFTPAGCLGENLFLGEFAGSLAATGSGQDSSYNTGIGAKALTALTTGHGNTAVGHTAGQAMTSGLQNTAIGSGALFLASTSTQNTALGHAALYSTTTGGGNTGLGLYALFSNGAGSWNTAIGAYSLMYQVDGTPNSGFTNCAGLGADTRVSGSNQVQLGNNTTTVYAYGAVQNRSDPRDKADMRPTQLGLDFILALQPVDFRWDYRDAYFDPTQSAKHDSEIEQGSSRECQQPDGTKKRNRFHHGLNAEQVYDAMKALGVDFGGYQDHKLQGGADVKTIGYSELIGPLIKAVQELNNRILVLEKDV